MPEHKRSVFLDRGDRRTVHCELVFIMTKTLVSVKGIERTPFVKLCANPDLIFYVILKMKNEFLFADIYLNTTSFCQAFKEISYIKLEREYHTNICETV